MWKKHLRRHLPIQTVTQWSPRTLSIQSFVICFLPLFSLAVKNCLSNTPMRLRRCVPLGMQSRMLCTSLSTIVWALSVLLFNDCVGCTAATLLRLATYPHFWRPQLHPPLLPPPPTEAQHCADRSSNSGQHLHCGYPLGFEWIFVTIFLSIANTPKDERSVIRYVRYVLCFLWHVVFRQ